VQAVSVAAGCDGRVERPTLVEAEERMGPSAEAFALDQQLTGAKARAELGRTPTRTDPSAEIAVPLRRPGIRSAPPCGA
jgi:hypothetical protein